ncbi:MAG: efflux RND transporter periplasmic adaptor subunit [Chitinophagaceae bacterium]
MKQIIKFSLFIFFAAGVLACNSTTKDKNAQLAEKKEVLQKKKDAVASLNDEIAKLENDVALLDTSAAKTEKPKLVAVTPVATQSFTHYIDLQGRVDAENISYVTPRGQGGQVRELYVKRGDAVRKGQLLMKLDDAILRQNLETAKTQVAYAQNIYQRQKNLWDQKIGTEVQLVTAQNNVDQAERNIATLEEQMKYANVYAEVSGIADEVNIKVGETFTGAPTSGIKIVNTSNLKVITDIPENYISRVKKGTPVVITIPDVTKTFNSTISLISQSIGTSSRGFTAECKLPANSSLKPNQIALIKIQDYTAPNALAIPVNTVQTDEKGKFVLVAANENGKMISRKRPIVLGELYGDKIEITSGLKEGDVLITEGFQGLYEGQLITTSTI